MATAYRPVAASAGTIRRRTAEVRGGDTAPLAGELGEVSAYGCRVILPAGSALDGAIQLSIDGYPPVPAQVVWNRAGVLACRFDAPIARDRLRALTIQDN